MVIRRRIDVTRSSTKASKKDETQTFAACLMAGCEAEIVESVCHSSGIEGVTLDWELIYHRR